MKTFTFASVGASGDNATALECTVLDGRDASDKSWVKSPNRFDDAVKAIIATAPAHNERAHLEAAIVISLVRADAAEGNAAPSIHIVIEPQRIVTVCYEMERLVGEAFEREAARGSPTSISRLLSLIVMSLIKQLQPELTDLSDRIDALEDAAMGDSDVRIDDQVVLAGQQILALRRFLAPISYEVNYLAINPDELPGTAEPRYLRRSADSLSRIIGSLDGAHHRVSLMLNQLGNRDTSRLEKTLHKLTLIATVFLPLGFVTGLLGINVAGIPGTHDPYAFWMVCGVLIAIAIGAILVIRWFRWT